MTNLILVFEHKHRICTFASDTKEVEQFVEELKQYLELTNDYEV